MTITQIWPSLKAELQLVYFLVLHFISISYWVLNSLFKEIQGPFINYIEGGRGVNDFLKSVSQERRLFSFLHLKNKGVINLLQTQWTIRVILSVIMTRLFVQKNRGGQKAGHEIFCATLILVSKSGYHAKALLFLPCALCACLLL